MKKILLSNLILIPFLCLSQASLVKDINPGSGDGVATYNKNRFDFDGSLLFAANDGSSGMELWKSDGTSSGTLLINTFNAGSLDGNPNQFYEFNNKVYFSAYRTTVGYELYSTDGTSSGLTTYNQLNVLSGNSSPSFFIAYNSNLIFSGNVSSFSTVYGAELLGFDGTGWSGPGDAIMIKNIHTGNGAGSFPNNFTELNGNLLFSAIYSSGGRELWITDGTNSGTNLILDINPGTANSNAANFTVFNNKVYFSADDGVNGRELWVTDGTVAGTYIVLDLYSGTTGSNPTNLIVYNNALYFTANHPTLGLEIFKMTTLENITNLKNINPGSGNSAPFGFTEYNGKLYFAADDGTNGVELWSTTGFSSTTNMLKDINTTGESTPLYFTEYFGKLYFNADDGVNGRELWSTDGTAAGTVLVQNINPGSMDSSPSDLIVSNDVLFFSANDGTHGLELWKYVDPALSIQDVALDNKTNLFPNPVSFDFSIETTADIESLSIYSIQGKLIKTFDLYQDSYNVEELSAGMYLLNIQTTEGFVTKKLIKE